MELTAIAETLANPLYSQITQSRWKRLWQSIPATGDGEAWFSHLVHRYSEPHRHYHNLQHLNECLMELDQVRPQVAQPAMLETALWFHDAIYDSQSGAHNESLSADLAAKALREDCVEEPFIEGVHSLILMTKTHIVNDAPDAAFMCDIDLSILGREEERFSAYEKAIRQEYAWVPEAEYVAGRRRVLEGFLERSHLYATPHFRERYEKKARLNLQHSIKLLKAGLLA